MNSRFSPARPRWWGPSTAERGHGEQRRWRERGAAAGTLQATRRPLGRGDVQRRATRGPGKWESEQSSGLIFSAAESYIGLQYRHNTGQASLSVLVPVISF